MAEITAAMIKSLRDATDCGMMDAKRALTETNGNQDAAIELLRKQGALKGGKLANRSTAQGRVGVALSKDGRSAALVEVQSETDFTARNDQFVKMVDEIAQEYADKGGEVTGWQDRLTPMIAKTGENMKFGKSARLTISGAGFFGTYLHSDFKLGVLVQVEGDEGKSDTAKALGKDLAMHAAASFPIALDRSGVPADYLAKEKEIAREAAKAEGKPEGVLEKIAEGKVNALLKEKCFVEQPFVKEPKLSVTQHVENIGKTLDKKLSVKAYARIKVGE
ncbi:MAG: translation elongation factor Ts [Planctomycetes bacterium]|nr:translation elongation factor Ts [Planctomycetota bacterium]